MSVPKDLRYTEDHEWVRIEGSRGRIGITHFAQDQLGDVVFVELPQVGTAVQAKSAFGVVESVKSMSDLYAPVSGTVTAVNESLKDHPENVNQDPYGEGWMIEVTLDDPGAGALLMGPDDYQKLTSGGH